MNKFTVIVLCCALVVASIFLLGMGTGPGGNGQRGGGPMSPSQMGQGQNQIFNQGMQEVGNQTNPQQTKKKNFIIFIVGVIRFIIAIIALVYLAKISRSLDIISRNVPLQKS
jgi:hypothetical protein